MTTTPATTAATVPTAPTAAGTSTTKIFNPAAAKERVEKFWGLNAEFGMERGALHVYLNEIVSDRYVLVNGLQLLRDELQLAGKEKDSDVAACGADLGVPSVMSTVATTNCGDRIHQGEATITYRQVVAARFASLSEVGELKMESFSPTGGGTDDGATLAHVTVAHQLDEPLRERVYEGNNQSFILVAIDLKTHCGRLDEEATHKVTYGKTQESRFREPRAACGAIVGTLNHFNLDNGVHMRLRRDLGEANFNLLSGKKVLASDGTDCTAAVAAAIVAVRGMVNTAKAMSTELDERGVAHLTASTTINRPSQNDTIVYLARATVFNGEIKMQGVGTDATKYSAKMVDHHGDKRLVLAYDGVEPGVLPVLTQKYEVRHWRKVAPASTAHHVSL